MGKIRDVTGGVRYLTSEIANMVHETENEMCSNLDKEYKIRKRICDIISYLVYIVCGIIIFVKLKG